MALAVDFETGGMICNDCSLAAMLDSKSKASLDQTEQAEAKGEASNRETTTAINQEQDGGGGGGRGVPIDLRCSVCGKEATKR